jgi:hypothetical protein
LPKLIGNNATADTPTTEAGEKQNNICHRSTQIEEKIGRERTRMKNNSLS